MTKSKIELYESAAYGRYRFLSKLSLQREFSEDRRVSTSLELELLDEAVPAGKKLWLRASGVSDLKVGNLNGIDGILLVVRGISAHQLEMARYRITDEETQTVAFNCHEFDFLLKG
jgi:hypothetical protein